MRRSVKTRKFMIRASLLMVIFSVVVSIGYAKLSSSISINGLVQASIDKSNYNIDPTSDTRLNMTMPTTNRWFSNNLYYYQFNFDINNITLQSITSFTATLDFNASITSVDIWNYDYTIVNNRITISDYSSSLSGDNNARVSFIVSSSSPLLTLTMVKLQGIGSTNNTEFTAAQLPVQFTVTNSWGNYEYQYDVKITNKTGKKLTAWSIEIPLPIGTTRTGGWNADFQMRDQTLIINNVTYNGAINKNGIVTIGLQLSTNVRNYSPVVSKRYGR